jgi:hypothetical protein
MFAAPFIHWNVGAGVPLAAAVKDAEVPAVTVRLVGCVVIAGATFTVSVAAVDVAELTLFVATTV